MPLVVAMTKFSGQCSEMLESIYTQLGLDDFMYFKDIHFRLIEVFVVVLQL
jgi:hypothetical protein